MNDPQDFEEFWPQFLRGHRSPALRWSHVAALGCGAGAAVAALRGRPVRAVLWGGAAVALAVASHHVIQGHGPENFGRPVWAARAFLRLCVRTVTGAIHAELRADPPA